LLNPADIIAGARLSTHPGVYVLGFYDTRITFYSQQVRALELVHALSHEHLLPGNARVAVVGGGAAGITVAAALALQGGVTIRLFEKAPRLLPLQGDSQRRRLDPHIYDWPNPDADHELAELPLLDWRSGASKDVRDAVLREFDEVLAVTEGRLLVHERHEVTNVTPQANRFIVAFEREGAGGAREAASEEFDLVILAIGFGVENRFALPGTDTSSYWHDAGVPGADIDGNPRPTFLVSGNGDGGLIDLIAASSTTFRHDDIVRGIAQRPGVQALREDLLAIDAQALDEDAAGRGFDFITAYENAVGARVEELGLVDQVHRGLRPGVQLFLQTRENELLSVRTARLNRFAVYLLRKACTRPGAPTFNHVVCDDVASVASEPGDRNGSRRFACGAQIVVADWVIARRGPGRDAIRLPFANLLAGFDLEHAEWVRTFPVDSIAPKLSVTTHAHFKRLADRAGLPPPRYHLAAMVAAMPRSAKLWLNNGEARWSGDLTLDDISDLWSDDTPLLDLTIRDAPDQLGVDLAHAVARLAIHAPRVELLLDVARWRPFLEALSSASPSAGQLQTPTQKALAGHPSILNPIALPPDEVAARINRQLDRWMLDAVDRHLLRYMRQAEDPGHAVSFVAAADLRAQMEPIWLSWKQRFQGEPDLLARFFALAVCAKDGGKASGEATVLVGRRLLPRLIRACAVAVAVATAWQVTAPRNAHPGNLGRDANGTERTGHTCAAGLINNEEMTLAALRHAWTTEFVVLPMEAVSPAVIAGANTSFGASAGGAPLLGQPGVNGKLMLTVDAQFRSAAQAGAADLAKLLIELEEDHFARLKKAIQVEGAAE